jgi:flavin reductase
MTANSLTSVSLDPMLILICVDQKARLHTYLKARKRFGVNILRASQREWSHFFAQPEQDPAEEQRLGVKFRRTPSGIPLLEGALAYLACNVVAQHTSGDHTIFVGEVESLAAQEGEPLVHHRGKYHSLKLCDK